MLLDCWECCWRDVNAVAVSDAVVVVAVAVWLLLDSAAACDGLFNSDLLRTALK